MKKPRDLLFSQQRIVRFIIYVIILQITVILLFALLYYGIRANNNFNGLTKTSSFLDCLYFSTTTASSVGYGDITPKSQRARGLVVIQQILILLNLSSLTINIILSSISL